MNSWHWPILPVLVPLAAGCILLLIGRDRLRVQAAIGIASVVAQLVIAMLIGRAAMSGEVLTYLLGNWAAPFGIALAADRLTALMLVLTALVALAALVAACRVWHGKSPFFHPLFQFQLMGLNGAFLTADLFNLFVFFEVLLIASYGLLVHGDGVNRVRFATQYVIVNLVGSALFLIGATLLYGALGTLNLADLAQRVATAPAESLPLVRAAGWLLLVVFGLKAALLPLYFWLPGTYSAASAPVAALFAIMTKVGVYAVMRVHTLVFGAAPFGAEGLVGWVLIPVALVTITLASLGALAAKSVRELAGFLVVVSAGTLLAMIGLAGEGALSAAMFYLVHSTLAAAVLFLLSEHVQGNATRTSTVGVLFLVAAVVASGLPPLSGFIAKVMILESAGSSPWMTAFFVVVVGTGLLNVMALARQGSRLFWKGDLDAHADDGAGVHAPGFAGVYVLLAALVALAVFAQPVARLGVDAARALVKPDAYIQAVLGTPTVSKVSSAQHNTSAVDAERIRP